MSYKMPNVLYKLLLLLDQRALTIGGSITWTNCLQFCKLEFKCFTTNIGTNNNIFSYVLQIQYWLTGYRQYNDPFHNMVSDIQCAQKKSPNVYKSCLEMIPLKNDRF